MDEFFLKGYVQHVPVKPTFLVPYFNREGSNLSFVQTLTNDFTIEGFAEYDIADFPSENNFTVVRPLRRRVGDSGLLAFLPNSGGPICGSREELLEVFRRILKEEEHSPFFCFEVAMLVGDGAQVISAVEAAQDAFDDKDRGNRWQLRERSEWFKSMRGSEAAWSEISSRLNREFKEKEFLEPLKRLTFHGISNGRIQLSVPTEFLARWTRTHIAERLRAIWSTEFCEVAGVEITIASAVQNTNAPNPQRSRIATPMQMSGPAILRHLEIARDSRLRALPKSC